MRKHYQFNDEDHRTIRAWQLGVAALYAGLFICFVAVIIFNNSVGGWASDAAQAEMTTKAPQSDAMQVASKSNRTFAFDLYAPYP